LRKLIMMAAGLTMGASAAHAADLYRPAPAYVPAVRAAYDWSGFYLGVNLGGAWAKSHHDFTVGGAQVSNNTSTHGGVIGGVQGGYNWQSGAWVLGVETDFQGSSIKGGIGTINAGAVAIQSDEKLPWFGTVRGRVGYAADNWLYYVTGGYAYGRVKNDTTFTSGGTTAIVSSNHTRSGWTVGGGVEWAFARNWTAKAEYLYIDFGTNTTNYAPVGLPGVLENDRVYANVVRAGLNYKF
jgi:outer membrane immunogenic protein